MDTNYIINRLKSTPYKYSTVALLRTRLSNLDEEKRDEILSNLKIERHRQRNVDINQSLEELLYKMPLAS